MKTTESNSLYNHLEQMSVIEILQKMNYEDQKVAKAVSNVLPDIQKLIESIVPRMKSGGRLFYIGAGTSGRLGVLDASECPPTFGVPHDWVIGLIAGGDRAIRKAVEFAEDDSKQAWLDISNYQPQQTDTVIGIAASGTTPYVIGGVQAARSAGLLTGSICCNAGSLLSKEVEHAIEVIVGPEFLTGSTRLKSGTAQKMVLNMITTSIMIQLGKVKGNKMVDMQLSNEKLIERGVQMLMDELKIDEQKAKSLIEQYGNVRQAIAGYRNSN